MHGTWLVSFMQHYRGANERKRVLSASPEFHQLQKKGKKITPNRPSSFDTPKAETRTEFGTVKRKRVPNGANDELRLPDPYDAVSVDGARWLWRYMRRLEEKYKNDDTDYTSSLVSVDESAKYWDAKYRNEQKTKLELQYTDFMESLARNADTSKQFTCSMEHNTEQAAIESYTACSKYFNRYLATSNPKLLSEHTKLGVHRLYKLLARCPRLEEQAVFLRSVDDTRRLPHNRYFAGERRPVIGRAYLNVTFMSTTIAEPNAFVNDALHSFFDIDDMCCIYAITAPAGLPILPLAFAGPNISNDHEEEAEVILPPGLLLVYQGERVLTLGSDKKEATVHFYQAVVPPKLDPLVETLSS